MCKGMSEKELQKLKRKPKILDKKFRILKTEQMKSFLWYQMGSIKKCFETGSFIEPMSVYLENMDVVRPGLTKQKVMRQSYAV